MTAMDKKGTTLVATALVALAAWMPLSCRKGEPIAWRDDIVGGRAFYSSEAGRAYAMHVADNLVTDALDELELALKVNSKRGPKESPHFEGSDSLNHAGVKWLVKTADSPFTGMTLQCVKQDSSWKLDFSGPLSRGFGNSYPTTFTMTATLLDTTILKRYSVTEEQWDGEAMGYVTRKNYAREGWCVTLQGERIERDGYSCTFETGEGGINYADTRGGAAGWNLVYGDLYMILRENSQVVDTYWLSFEGAPSGATFIQGI